MARRARCTCGLEIGKGTISLAQYYHEENTVAGVAIKPIENSGKGWWDSIQSEFKGLIGSMKVGGLDVVVSLPSESTVIKRINLDNNESDVDDAVRWEISQHLIGSMDDYTIDYERLPGTFNGDVASYLVAASGTSVIADIAALVRAHKLNPVIVDLDVFALINLFETNYPENIPLPSFILYGSEEFSKVVLTRDGGFVDCEVVRTGPDQSDSAAYATLINQACARLASVNAPVVGSQAPALFMSGGLFAEDAFATACLQNLNNAEMLSPFKSIGCRAISADDAKKFAPQLGVAVGLALRGVKG